jgi:hypothetical protein
MHQEWLNSVPSVDGALDLDGVAQLTGVTSTPSGGTAWIAAK